MQYLFETLDTVLAKFGLDTWLLARERLFLRMQKYACHANGTTENVVVKEGTVIYYRNEP